MVKTDQVVNWFWSLIFNTLRSGAVAKPHVYKGGRPNTLYQKILLRT